MAWKPGATPPGAVFALHWSAEGRLDLGAGGVRGGDGSLDLAIDPAGLPAALLRKFPQLEGYLALKIAPADLAAVPEILRGQAVLTLAAADGAVLEATSLQIPGVLDDLFAWDGRLGAEAAPENVTLRLWAPTAQSVTLLLFADPDPQTEPQRVSMSRDSGSGVWSATGGQDWMGAYYLYEVTVWAASTGRVETNRVTDPYALSLAADSSRSQIVDLDDTGLQPPGWNTLAKPALKQPEDIVLYELHVRDFSWFDPAVPEAERGTFRAFARDDSHGMRHLAALAEAGLTHVHLLPAFDIASVPERRVAQLQPAGDLAGFAPDSERQQAAVAAVAGQDGFNWGYDPWHYTVPEGSYATDPEGPRRILEFRQMVQSLNRHGLRVVMDVVYNHTHAAGQDAKSVLDRVVPGYYHRLNADGAVETSTCCPNTASEHAMMEKLMIDSIVTWARDYKVDGFRFDLMGHHSRATLLAVRAALDALTEADDGVDGHGIYLYGEGWNFGEVADNARFVQATQANLAGTGIGTFNDRIRDGVRGGRPFSGLQEQGFATGLFYDTNAIGQGSAAEQADRLLAAADWIRVSLAGGLARYPLVDRHGESLTGGQVDYLGQPAGYTHDPQENINYAAAHDNETLFDAIALKVPVGTPLGDRIRVQNMASALVALGQGVPFFHAGQDLLRSKSLDRDSYDSGDWFNRLDFTYTWNNWGAGLPPASHNRPNWAIMQPLLADPRLRAGREEIGAAAAYLRELLRIRKSSGLFRLPDEQAVIDHLRFLNTGPGQIPGLIVMLLSDPAGEFDRRYQKVVVLFNANDEPQQFFAPALAGDNFRLHEVQQASSDKLTSSSSWNQADAEFRVPARTTAVFVARHGGEERED